MPTGTDLGTSTIDGDTLAVAESWYEFEFSNDIPLKINTQYAIVVRALDGDAANYVDWRWLSTGGMIVGEPGNAGHSLTSGSTWLSDAPADYLFEIWDMLL